MTLKYLFTLSFLILFSTTTNAIVIRHDGIDKEYLDLARPYQPSIAILDRCVATVLSDYWLITAAHCVSTKNKYPVSIEHLGVQYPVNKILLHPETDKLDQIDVALLQLRWPLKNAVPVAVYGGTSELNQQVVFVGNGKTGNGKIGETVFDDQFRAATNTVRSVETHWLTFRFDSQSEATRYEGVSGTDDSGGPALLKQDGHYQLIGVGCCQEPGKNTAGEEVQGIYGSIEHYSRVSNIKPWIDNTLTQVPVNHESTIADLIKQQRTLEAKKLIADTDFSTLSNTEIEEIIISSFYFSPDIVNDVLGLLDSIEEIRIGGLPLIVYAYMQGNGEILATLIKKGVSIDYTGFKGQQLPALLAWQYFQDNYEYQLSLLLDKGLDVNRRDKRGDTALHMAAFYGQPGRIKSLIKLGADPTIKNNKGLLAKDVAEKFGHDSVVQLEELSHAEQQ